MTPFNKQMKSIIFTLFLMLPAIGYSADQMQISCANNQCNSSDLTTAEATCQSITSQTQCEAKVLANLCSWTNSLNTQGGSCSALPQPKICAGYNCEVGQTMSIMKFRGVLNKDLNVLTTSTGHPQNVGISFNAGAFPGVNANISVGAQNETSNSANILVIADNVKNLSINLDGYSGKQGKSSAQICAQKIKNGDYGTDLQTYFNTRRSTTNADPDKCDADDLNYMQTFNFTCDDPAFTEVPSNDPTVQVSQIKKQARCSAVASYNYCIKRKINVTCNYRLWSAFRQNWFQNKDLAHTSYYEGPATCNDQYVACGAVYYQCSGSQIQSIQPTTYSGSGFNYNQCSYGSTSGQTLCSGCGGFGGGTCSGSGQAYYKTTHCVFDKSPTMAMTQQLSINGVDEEFFNSEVSRLGSVDRFCDIHGQKPPKSNQHWWGGVPGAPGNLMGTVAGVANRERNGIPWEFMGEYQSGKFVTAVEPQGAIVAWKNDTAQNGGYNVTVTNAGGDWISKGAYWKANGSTLSYTSPGLNPDGITVAVGSVWQVTRTNTFEACPAGWSVLKNIFINLVQYTNKENTSCSGISDSQDPNNRAFWQYTGISQESTFGVESVTCNIGACAVGSTVSELSRSLDTIPPQSGENGTEQGRGLVFAYDIQNLAATSVAGGSGATGLADISVNPQTRVCVKIDDANAGINTPQAKNPFVSFRRYSWQVLKSTAGGNPGTPPRNTGKTVEVFKKIDPAARYLLDKTLL